MKETKNLIIKLNHKSEDQISCENVKIRKIVSSISPLSFIHLFHYAENKVNPRTATVNSVVKNIEETLEQSPELFFFKSKGLLISTLNCERYDRNRIKLSYEETDTEGIMDGGHNAFAIARFIIGKLYNGEIKFKEWKDCNSYWKNEDNYKDILTRFKNYPDGDTFNFSIPLEIISPINESEEATKEFYDNISEICSARNANVQLTEAAMGNKVGCFDYLKENVLPAYPIIWRNGEPGDIKVDDVIALASLPLIKLSEVGYFKEYGYEIGSLNKISVYSQKSKCMTFFKKVMMDAKASHINKGTFILDDEVVKSALLLVDDILRFFDRMYYYFPVVYNKNSGSFGRITGVTQKCKAYQGIFKTYAKKSDYKYAPGFYYPLICGLTELMDLKNGKLVWLKNPSSINLNSDEVINSFTQYMNLIRLLGYNPNKVGKEQSMYHEGNSVMKIIASL